MYLKKLFYKFTNKDKHFFYKNSLKRDNHEKIIKRIYDSEIRNKIENLLSFVDESFGSFAWNHDEILYLISLKENNLTRRTEISNKI